MCYVLVPANGENVLESMQDVKDRFPDVRIEDFTDQPIYWDECLCPLDMVAFVTKGLKQECWEYAGDVFMYPVMQFDAYHKPDEG